MIVDIKEGLEKIKDRYTSEEISLMLNDLSEKYKKMLISMILFSDEMLEDIKKDEEKTNKNGFVVKGVVSNKSKGEFILSKDELLKKGMRDIKIELTEKEFEKFKEIEIKTGGYDETT